MESLIDLRIWLEWTTEPRALAERGSGGSLGLQDICRIVWNQERRGTLVSGMQWQWKERCTPPYDRNTRKLAGEERNAE